MSEEKTKRPDPYDTADRRRYRVTAPIDDAGTYLGRVFGGEVGSTICLTAREAQILTGRVEPLRDPAATP